MSDREVIDKARMRRSFAGAAQSYDAAAVLQQQVGQRLRERLELVRLAPKVILDAGAGTGDSAEALLRQYPKARVYALDLAMPMLRRARERGRFWRRPVSVCGDFEGLPLADQSVDLLFSNMALQWCADPVEVFREAVRVLRPEGLLMFTSVGPDTLHELRAAWAEAGSARQHVSPFIDMHDLGDAMIHAGLADPVLDVEHFTLTYERVEDLMRDLKAIGARNASVDRAPGLTGKQRLQRVREAYESRRRDGRLPATYEVVYGHAWAPKQRSVGHETHVPISTITRAGRP